MKTKLALFFLVSLVATLMAGHDDHKQQRGYGDYVPVLDSVKKDFWPVDPKKGYLARAVKDGVYVITDGVWQSMFVVTGAGVVVIDAPETFAHHIPAAVAEVTQEPIKILVYSYIHKDHIGGSAAFSEIEGLKIVALDGVAHFLKEKQDPERLIPNQTFSGRRTLNLGNRRIELVQHRNFHSDEGDLFIYIPDAKVLMAVDTLTPGYVPFKGFDLTSNFHEYLKVFDDILSYEFDVFVGGHLTHPGTREDVVVSKEYTLDVYETVKRVHNRTDLGAVMAETAQQAGGWDNKFLLFKAFLDKVTIDATEEIEKRWIDRLAGVDVWAKTHVETALIYVRWDD